MDMQRIEDLVAGGYIKQTMSDDGDLIILNYTQKTQFEGYWTPETMMCRGLVLDKHGNVVARPFNKIFNYGERGEFYPTTNDIVSVTEKMDGSLGIGFYYNDSFHIVTRGSFNSDQAQWAMRHLVGRAGNPRPEEDSAWTFLFEIIYPENRIVVDYRGEEELCLLAMRNKHTGAFMPRKRLADYADWYGMSLVPQFHFNSIKEIKDLLPLIDANQEGWVAEFADGSRFKFKGGEYVKLHKLISGLSKKKAAQAVLEDKIEEYTELIPDEFLGEWNEWIEEIAVDIALAINSVNFVFRCAPPGSRKTFALWAKDFALSQYLFALYDGKDIRAMLFKDLYGVQ